MGSGLFESLRTWLITVRLRSRLLRAGGLRVTACLRSALRPAPGVEFGAVGRQVEDLDLCCVPGQPALHQAGAVNGQVVQDQEHLGPVPRTRRRRKRVRAGSKYRSAAAPYKVGSAAMTACSSAARLWLQWTRKVVLTSVKTVGSDRTRAGAKLPSVDRFSVHAN